MPAISSAVLNICRDDDEEGSLRECGRENKGCGELIKDVKYADDQGIVANTEAGLQSLMNSLNTTAKHYDMKININKTKAMKWGLEMIQMDGGRKMGEKWGRESEHNSRRSKR